jgi:hypothetical protein
LRSLARRALASLTVILSLIRFKPADVTVLSLATPKLAPVSNATSTGIPLIRALKTSNCRSVVNGMVSMIGDCALAVKTAMSKVISSDDVRYLSMFQEWYFADVLVWQLLGATRMAI